jgi:5-methylcytosine-specific restriction endonuclease McrA
MSNDDIFDDLEKLRASTKAAQQAIEVRTAAELYANRFNRAARHHDDRIPHETRMAVLERADDHCEGCGRPLSSFNSQLHHVTYCRAYGDELPEDLMALCDDCHKAEHGL